MNPLLRILEREYAYFRNKPAQGSFELTYRCNCRCYTCNVWKLNRNEGELKFEEIASTVDQMKNLGIKSVSLVGAEPFMRDDLLSIIKYIKTKGLECNVTTNGTLIDAGLAEELCKTGIDRIICSIDEIGEGHDNIRSHKGAFNKAVSAIGYLKRSREKLKSRNPSLPIHVTLSRFNVNDTEKLCELKEFTGADSLGFSYACQTQKEDFRNTVYQGRPIASSRLLFEERDYNFSKEDVAGLRNHAERLMEKNKSIPFSLKSLISWSEANLIRNVVPIRKCYAAKSIVVIDPYGNVLPCSNLDRFIYGNIRNNALAEILGGSNRKGFLKRIAKRFFPACKSCTNFCLTPFQLINVFLGTGLKDRGNFS